MTMGQWGLSSLGAGSDPLNLAPQRVVPSKPHYWPAEFGHTVRRGVSYDVVSLVWHLLSGRASQD
jgi:hypothetical protein